MPGTPPADETVIYRIRRPDEKHHVLLPVGEKAILKAANAVLLCPPKDTKFGFCDDCPRGSDSFNKFYDSVPGSPSETHPKHFVDLPAAPFYHAAASSHDMRFFIVLWH